MNSSRVGRICFRACRQPKSFRSIFEFLSLAIRQPRHMVDYSRHFSFVILNEGQLRAIELDEEIRFRFGINIESASADVLAPGLPDQLISFPPDRQFDSSGKRGVRRKFVVADTGIKKFRVQLDGDMRFEWFGGFGRLIGDFRIRESSAPGCARLNGSPCLEHPGKRSRACRSACSKKRVSDSGNNSTVICGNNSAGKCVNLEVIGDDGR